MSHEIGTNTPDTLFAGSNQLPVSDGETILQGENVVRGEVLGKITASGKWVTFNLGNANGSEIPRGIASEDINAAASDMESVVYKTGEFNANALVFSADSLTEAVKNLLQDVNIHTKPNVDTSGVHNS